MSEPKNESQDPVVPTSAELAEGDYTESRKTAQELSKLMIALCRMQRDRKSFA